MNRAKNFWILLLLLMTGIVLGGFIGNMASGVRGLSWLNYGQSFGLMDPVVLDLGILVITFGLSIRVTMASIIGVVIALIAYRLIYSKNPAWWEWLSVCRGEARRRTINEKRNRETSKKF